MANLIFNEQSFIDQNVFKYEQRLNSSANKFIENGAILSKYWNLNENAVTVDRGLRDIEQLFGRNAPLRWNSIENFPLYSFPQLTPTNTDESNVEDIMAEGECVILPSTLVPHQNDFFILNHLKMRAIFQVTEVMYDSMKEAGYYKIKYRLHSTSIETIENLQLQTVKEYIFHMDNIGNDINPIISKEDSDRRGRINKIIANMINDYTSLFYNPRHNCYLLTTMNNHYPEQWFDTCANEFMAKHSLMNMPNSTNVILLQSKLYDTKFPIRYQQSIYRWIEDQCPIGKLNKFPITTEESYLYHTSTFARWSERDIKIVFPDPNQRNDLPGNTIFNEEQISFFRESGTWGSNSYENIIKNYIHGNLDDISKITLDIGNELSVGTSDSFIYFLTPIIIYILRKALSLN